MASHTNTHPDKPSTYTSPKPTTIDIVGGIYCHICNSTYANKRDYDIHYAKHETGTKDIVYTCVVCRKGIAGYPSFRGHCYTSHVIKDRFKCEHCCKLFSKFSSLREHVVVMHRFKCSTCKKEFTSKKELKLHEIIHNDNDSPPYKCQACSTQIDTLEGCKNHIDMHSAFIYFCPICNENISNKENAPEHLKKHFGDVIDTNTVEIQNSWEKEESSIEHLGGISCGYCSLIYKNRMEFDAHFSCEHGDKDIVYRCIVCGKQFDKYSVFSDHAYNHFTKDRFCCDICLKTFNRLSLLVTHTSACQADAEASGKPFACPACGHRYGSELRLREHLRLKHGRRRPACAERGCREVFATPKELMFHQRLHRSNQNWCRQCGLLFTSLASCERHLDVHKKKLYVCPVCNKNYSEKHLILKHVSQHFETVLHLCKVCGKVYNAKNRLIEHIKTHSETKTHSCTYCGKSFVKIGQLQQHLNVHTGSKPYKCPVCSKSFASYPNWHKHLRRMHKSDGKNFKKPDPEIEEESNDVESIEEFPLDIDIHNIEVPKDEDYTHAKFHVELADFIDTKLDKYMFNETNDGTIESDRIDPVVVEEDLEPLGPPAVPMPNPPAAEGVEGLAQFVNGVAAEDSECLARFVNGMAGEGAEGLARFVNGAAVEGVEGLARFVSGAAVEGAEGLARFVNGAAVEGVEGLARFVNGAAVEGVEGLARFVNGAAVEGVEGLARFVNGAAVEGVEGLARFVNGAAVEGVEGLARFVNASAGAVPAEYGPEFSGVIDLDDHMLPHIDPLLTISRPPEYEPFAPKWEPLITKVYQDYSYGYGEMESGRLSIINTDIF